MFSAKFLRDNWRELLFGFAMCFLSSFGQTFFISLFGGKLRAELGISDGQFGTYYALGTLGSAAVLVWSGRLVDRLRLRDMAAMVLGGLGLVCAAMSFVTGPVMLVLVFFGLRQFGQGLASHTGVTAAARRFAAERGRALSLTSLGHSAGEALLPVLVVAAMTPLGWRNIWLITAALLLVSIPVIRRLIGQGTGEPLEGPSNGRRPAATGHDHTVAEVLREPSLWLRIPVVLAPSFIYTGLIFHQISIVEDKGWALTYWASSYILLALSATVMIMLAGPLVDRFTSISLLRIFLLPLAVSCIALWMGNALWVVPAFMIAMGLSAGLCQVVFAAVWAELYGVKNLGAVRALAQAAMVFSSGMAPAVMGLAMDAGVTVETIALLCAIYCVVASAIAAVAPAPRKETA
jgi:MFS family permease